MSVGGVAFGHAVGVVGRAAFLLWKGLEEPVGVRASFAISGGFAGGELI